MVAKINKGSSLYGALSYNQEKVDNGEATVINSQGILHDENMNYNINDCMRSFELYMIANNRTKKPVVHISLNPDPKDIIDDDNAALIAQDYMEQMGYGEQPYLLYKHNDIDRVHYHIVTVCVDETGAKINDKYERRRSMAACRKIEKEYNLHIPNKYELKNEYRVKPVDYKKGDITKQIRSTVGALIQDYRVSSLSEFKTLLEQFDCTMTQVEGKVGDRQIHGIVYSALDENKKKVSRQLKSSIFGKEYGYKSLQWKFKKDKERIQEKDLDFTKRIVVQCMYQCKIRSKEELTELLKKRGIDIVLNVNKENRIYGVTFINHNNRTVIKGSKLGTEFSANYLRNFFDNPHFLIPFPNENKGYEHSPSKEKEEGENYGAPFSLFPFPDGYDQDEGQKKKRKKKKNNDEYKI